MAYVEGFILYGNLKRWGVEPEEMISQGKPAAARASAAFFMVSFSSLATSSKAALVVQP